jgi:KUP system potassium uptake protein
VISPAFEEAVIPIALGILLALFLVQWRGTGSMGAVFGPVCALWFATLATLGLVEIVQQPGVLVALSPHYAIQFCAHYQLRPSSPSAPSCWR